MVKNKSARRYADPKAVAARRRANDQFEWPARRAAKGIDDALAAGAPIKALKGDEALAALESDLRDALAADKTSKSPQITGVLSAPPRRPKYEPFPVSMWPPPFSTYVREAAAAIGCDPAAVALPGLGTVAGAIGNSYVLHLKDGWDEPAVLWTAVVDFSGSLKSPGFRAAVNPFYRAQMRLADKHKEAVEKWRRQPLQHRQANPGQAPAPERCFVTSDATVQAVAALLAENAKGVLLAAEELDAWFQSFTRFSGKGGASDRAHWLPMHGASTLRVHRRTGEQRVISVRHAAVSITGTIQPHILARALDAEARAAGLAARVWMAMPPRRGRKWTEDRVRPELASRYLATLCCLLRLEYEDALGPYPLTMDEKAKARWVAWFDDWNRRRPAGEMGAVWAKLEGGAARLALIHHVLAHLKVPHNCDEKEALADLEKHLSEQTGDKTLDLPSKIVSDLSMEAGIATAEWFAREAERIFAILSEGEAEREAADLLEWVAARGGVVSARDLERSSRRYGPGEAEATLRALAAAGFGAWEHVLAGPQGGRPSDVFRLNADETPLSQAKSGVSSAQPPDEDFEAALESVRTYHDKWANRRPQPEDD
jgi:hypothetical protein